MRRTRRWLRATLHYGKTVAPFLISFGLVTWLIWKITPEKLLLALSVSNWPWLVLATLVQLVVLFLWDTFNLWWLFSQPNLERPLPFGIVLRARTDTVIWSALNLEIGQGVFAYRIAKATGAPVILALGRFLVLSLFDFGTLQSLGLIGSFLVTNPLIAWLRWVCLTSTMGLFMLALILHFLPQRWRQWLVEKPWASWLQWWSWRHSLLLWAQRLAMFLLVILYAWVSLRIVGINLGVRTIFGAIPFVIIAESLPGTGGLGERETALVYLLNPGGKEAELLALGLIWSTVIILGRIAIGLVSAMLPHAKDPSERDGTDAGHRRSMAAQNARLVP